MKSEERRQKRRHENTEQPRGSRRAVPLRAQRRAAALAGAVLVIAMINIAVLSAVTGAGDDAMLAGQRAQTIRAFLAAESGVTVAITEFNAGREPPADPFELPGGEEVEIESSGAVTPIDVDIEGRFGLAVRRLEVRVD